MNIEIQLGVDSTCGRSESLKHAIVGKVHNQLSPLELGTEKRGKRYVTLDGKPCGFLKSAQWAGENISASKLIEILNAQYATALSKAKIIPKSVEGDGKGFICDLCLDDKLITSSSSATPAITSAIKQKVAEGVFTQEEIDDRVSVLLKNNVQESLIIAVINQYKKFNKPSHIPKCIYVDPYLKKEKEGIIAEGLRCALYRMPSVCEGDKSVGKNVYMETLAWLLGMPLYMIGFSRNMNPASIYGEKSTDNSASEALKDMRSEAMAKVMIDQTLPIKDMKKAIEAAANFELAKARAASVSIIVDQSELYDWMVGGGVMVLNEMNMAEANFFSSFINPLTDGTGFLFFPGRGEVKMSPDCVLFGTQNSDYEGTMSQNEATISRFNTLYFPQPENIIGLLKNATETELKKLGMTGSVDSKMYDRVQAFYKQCLKAVQGNGQMMEISSTVLNIRGFVRALTAVASSNGYCSLQRWVEIAVVNSCPQEEKEALLTVLRTTIPE